MIEVNHIHFSAGNKKILQDVSASFLPGTFSMILGPNGSGKSTLLKIFSGFLAPKSGTVKINGEYVNSFSPAKLATFRSVLSQQSQLNFPLKVSEVIMMGRYPHFKQNPSKRDKEICNEVACELGLQHFMAASFAPLSGGEKQRVKFAKALAQVWDVPDAQPRYLFLDEPVNSLDINHQQEFMQLARSFLNPHTTLIAVMHDVNLALQFAGSVVVLNNGKVAGAGAPQNVLQPRFIKEVFGVDVQFFDRPDAQGQVMYFG